MTVSGITPSQPSYQPMSWGAAPAKPRSAAAAEFMEWAKMTPGERMRADILAGMKLDDDKLAAMSPEEREKVEARIREIIETKAREDLEGKTGVFADRRV